MSDEYQNPQPEEFDEKEKNDAPHYRWYQVWGKVFANPDVTTYEDVLADVNITFGRAAVWMLIASLVRLVPLWLFLLAMGGNEVLFPLLLISGFFLLVTGVAEGVHIGALYLLGGIGGARRFGLRHFFYGYAAATAPLYIVATIVSFVGANPLFFYALNLYRFVQEGLLLRTAHGIGWWRVILTVIGVALIEGFILSMIVVWISELLMNLLG